MRIYPKRYQYAQGKDAALDAQFACAPAYGKVRLGSETIFFKSGFWWYAVPFSIVLRAFRRMDMVYGKLCCGGSTYDVQMLVLVLTDRSELEIHIGDDMKLQAEQLFEAIRQAHPQLQFGKPQSAPAHDEACAACHSQRNG